MIKFLKNVLLLLLLVLLLFIMVSTKVDAANVPDSKTYDVILFWGQSNMVGYAGAKSNEKLKNTKIYYDTAKTKTTDPRIANEEILNKLFRAKGYTENEFTRAQKYARLTGINYKKIVQNTKSMNYVEIMQVQDPNNSNRGTAFEYLVTNGKTKNLKSLNSESYNIGEKITYIPTKNYLNIINDIESKLEKLEKAKKDNNEKAKKQLEKEIEKLESKRYNEMMNGKFEEYNSNKHSYFSIQESYGTNMIPEFCKEYYELTGRKVVVVMCANGGESISNFLPVTDKDYGYKENETPQYIYETMVMKYNETIDYLIGRGYKIGKRYYVVSQARCAKDTDKEDNKQANYEKIFKKVHNYLKQDLGITKGAIVISGSAPGTKEKYSYKNVRPVQQAQLNLIKNNQDIILASDFHYRNYLPDKETYNNVKKGIDTKSYVSDKFKKRDGTYMEYADALELAKLSLCTGNTNVLTNNSHHFTAAALSQTGLETAQNFAKFANTK